MVDAVIGLNLRCADVDVMLTSCMYILTMLIANALITCLELLVPVTRSYHQQCGCKPSFVPWCAFRQVLLRLV